jgi:5-oxoprolinase (ATP-hydrolysing) subunit A
MGEGIGNEAQLMPYITSANIACGYHAGNEATMNEVVKLCIAHNVHIGAHPSFNDRENFGRTEMHLSPQEIYRLVTIQLKILQKVVAKQGATIHHVKPHGALYNMAAKDVIIATAIIKAVKDFDTSLVFYSLSGSRMIEVAKQEGIRTFNEVFADRTYQADGNLTPRSQPNALISNINEVLQQVNLLATKNKVICTNKTQITLVADTICIHGDGAHAVAFAKATHEYLNK